jgi:hypothetical protein
MTKPVVQTNRAPVLTLWGAVVAERLGYETQSALSLGKALSGLNAQAKGRSLGIFHPKKAPDGGPPKKVGLGEEFWIELCGRGIPAKNTDDGIRAVVKDKPVDPAGVQQYLKKKFGEDLDRVKEAMRDLAESFESEGLASRAYSLYEKFRPVIPRGKRGWGAKGDLDLDLIRSLAE